MKILHVVSSLNMGGAEQFVVDITAAMNQQSGIQAEILSFGRADDALCQHCGKHDITVHHLSQAGRLQQLVQLRRLVRRYDAVHIHSSHCVASLLVSTLFLSGCRLYYTRHNTVIHRSGKWRLIYRLASIRLSKIVFIAEIARQDFLQAYPVFQEKSTLIYNGIRPVRLDPVVKATDRGVIRLGQVGRFVPLKAQKLLIQALHRLSPKQRQGFELHFFGDGPLLDDCRHQAESLQQDMGITFHGLEMDKSRIYQSIDVLVVTSETEGLSLVMLEALSAGCLVIATKVGGNEEIIEHGRSGLLYHYPKVQELAQCLTYVLTDARWRDLALAGNRRFDLMFEQERCVSSYLTIYRS
ncbi:glycosyltransferase family 4 protein [Alkalimonas sp. MEB108]|uniref:Glycosyltransferase family 4 protein n=1 Tax=Alkalimonas cellulosilytica TaxID=3058395 RepID=A0ABU7J1W0_9GAMM|nr:glycosyltransferase family 4 protein [Alkalimonas sp. MEB108]MEE2000417.1 glycosyltransferase family 4 protein [Alkalimonas sp. MEB108]